MNRLPLHEFHEAHGHMSEFAGFEMPLWYEGITSEHLAVRNSVGLFDISHMGRVQISGERTPEFLDYVTSRSPSLLQPFQGHYTVMCNPNGGVIDDLIVYRLNDCYLMVYNAANRMKDFQWLTKHAITYDVEVKDVSDTSIMLAVQGPNADPTIQSLSHTDLSQIKRFWVAWTELSGIQTLLMRSGYTGETGFEIILFNVATPPQNALKLWQSLLEGGKKFQIKPCGLGARDSLRLEAGLCLYGNDLTDEITPYEARLNFVVNLDKPDFIGKTALTRQKNEGVPQIRVGIRLIEQGIPRQGYKLYHEGNEVGYITSGGFSPLLRQGIAMGYVPPHLSEEGTHLEVNIRDRFVKASIVKMPFFDPTKYGWRRKN